MLYKTQLGKMLEQEAAHCPALSQGGFYEEERSTEGFRDKVKLFVDPNEYVFKVSSKKREMGLSDERDFYFELDEENSLRKNYLEQKKSEMLEEGLKFSSGAAVAMYVLPIQVCNLMKTPTCLEVSLVYSAFMFGTGMRFYYLNLKKTLSSFDKNNLESLAKAEGEVA